MTKLCFEVYSNRLVTSASTLFFSVVGSSVYSQRDAKYVSAIFFSSHRPAKIYVKSNLLTVSVCDALST
jgi:hypothetical protein